MQTDLSKLFLSSTLIAALIFLYPILPAVVAQPDQFSTNVTSNLDILDQAAHLELIYKENLKAA